MNFQQCNNVFCIRSSWLYLVFLQFKFGILSAGCSILGYDMRSPPSAIDGTARILEAADLSGTIVAHNAVLVVTVALPHSKSKDPEDPEARWLHSKIVSLPQSKIQSVPWIGFISFSNVCCQDYM